MDNLEDWGIDGLIKRGGVMIMEGGDNMKTKVIRSGNKGFEEVKHRMFEPVELTKEEQLRLVFRNLIKQFAEDLARECFVGDMINSYADMLLKEVKIRTKL